MLSERFAGGMTLIEVLVALLVLSVGMLGIALLFVHGLRGSRSALLRTQAVNLVSDMAERIRANSGGRAAYRLAAYGGNPVEQGCAADAAGGGAGCSEEQLAQDDLARWLEEVRALLPPAVGLPAARVDYFSGQPEQYRIVLNWIEPGETRPLGYETEVLTAASSF